MTKFIVALLGFIYAGAILISCSTENADDSCPIGFVLLFIAIATVSGYVWSKFFAPKTIHITEEIYNDLDRQIEGYASGRPDGYYENEFESDNVAIKVAIRNKTTQTKFRDDAWGHSKTFTETNWYCAVEVLKVKVYDENNNLTDNHDFDEGLIETEYESTGNWE